MFHYFILDIVIKSYNSILQLYYKTYIYIIIIFFEKSKNSFNDYTFIHIFYH